MITRDEAIRFYDRHTTDVDKLIDAFEEVAGKHAGHDLGADGALAIVLAWELIRTPPLVDELLKAAGHAAKGEKTATG